MIEGIINEHDWTNKFYIGDGVEVYFDGDSFVLEIDSYDEFTKIKLRPEAFECLRFYLESLRKRNEKGDINGSK